MLHKVLLRQLNAGTSGANQEPAVNGSKTEMLIRYNTASDIRHANSPADHISLISDVCSGDAVEMRPRPRPSGGGQRPHEFAGRCHCFAGDLVWPLAQMGGAVSAAF